MVSLSSSLICKLKISCYTSTDIQNRDDRNFAIINAYLDGYTQAEIANHLNLSKSLVSKVIKSGDVTPAV